MSDKDRENEIRQIEDDLRNLHRRYGALDRSARQMKAIFYLFIVALLALIVLAIAIGNMPALVASTITLIIVGIVAYSARERRWIEFGLNPSVEGFDVMQTEAEAIEDMVAERLQRLARLKGNYK